MRLSVGRTGQCWDDALAEAFFATSKRELLVQLAPSVRRPRLPQSSRIRERIRSLTTTPIASAKAEQAHVSGDLAV
ncbi:hypothetical protein STRTUCAR8_09194 [Streptomyces turgidiscabies Car8]|uniref:Uncharacterized protein n=1 Tax=Streptomyces turgidiscabies (strain Car8) TaxID=698760 RepID=L7F202_STRT8|nr:hypothetical protein STRTUCAR8_09194 [Streptomyces turgidiscabies Car8]